MSEDAVRLKSVKKNFRSGADGALVCAVDDISLSMQTGSFTIIGGANGSGKSVLMQLIAGLMKPSAGAVWTSSRPGLVFQEAATQLLGETPREDVSVGPKNLGMKKKDIPAVVEKALASVSLLHKADYTAGFLSGGEKRRLAVASILAMDRDIIIFDEPYANLDWPGIQDVNTLLFQLKAEGKTILLLTHELEKCLGMADHLVVLAKGKSVFDGTPEDALRKSSADWTQWGIRHPLVAYTALSDLVWR